MKILSILRPDEGEVLILKKVIHPGIIYLSRRKLSNSFSTYEIVWGIEKF